MSVHKYKTKKGDRWYVKYDNITKRGFLKKTDALRYEAKLKLQEEEPQKLIMLHDFIDDYLKKGVKNVTFGTIQTKKSNI